VDDDRTFQFVLKKHVETLDLTGHADFFDDGDRALMGLVEVKKNGGHVPKVIFLDLRMKYLEGWRFLDTITDFGIDTKVVILTSSLLAADRERAQQHRLVSGFLNKPVTIEGLKRILQEAEVLS
jgi:CheY-like chemotaxis protein